MSGWLAALRLLGVGLVLVAAALLAEVAVPPLAARVTDLTATLNSAQRAALENLLAAFEAEKGSQIAVLIVPTTRPEPIETYSIRVADVWKLGRQGVDDGLLILLAIRDRSVRIEVGRGLEGVIPDAVAKRIIEEVMLPYFRQGDFYGGLSAGLDRIMDLIRGEPLPQPMPKPTASAEKALGVLLVGQEEWERICRQMEAAFRQGHFEEGILAGVLAVGEHLTRHFQDQGRAGDELPDRPAIHDS